MSYFEKIGQPQSKFHFLFICHNYYRKVAKYFNYSYINMHLGQKLFLLSLQFNIQKKYLIPDTNQQNITPLEK